MTEARPVGQYARPQLHWRSARPRGQGPRPTAPPFNPAHYARGHPRRSLLLGLMLIRELQRASGDPAFVLATSATFQGKISQFANSGLINGTFQYVFDPALQVRCAVIRFDVNVPNV